MKKCLFYKKTFLHYFCTPYTYKKISNPPKRLKERIERLIDLKPYNTVRMKLILDNAIGVLNLVIADRMKNLDDIEMNIMMQEGEIKLERIKKSLDELEMNVVKIKINDKIEILKKKLKLKNEEKKIKNIIGCLKKIKSWIIRSLYKLK